MSMNRREPEEIGAGRRWGMKLFNRQLLKARWNQLWRRLINRPVQMPTLTDLRVGQETGQWHMGLRTVFMAEIKGSEGRVGEFDAAFRPLQNHTRDRWATIAALMLAGTPLPPVELLQVGDVYVVRDGHHRISVAKALGQTAVDANVTRIGG